MRSIQSYSVYQPLGDSGGDRTYRNDTIGVYGLFDGVGFEPYASDWVRNYVDAHARDVRQYPEQVLISAHEAYTASSPNPDIQALKDEGLLATTALLLHIRKIGRKMVADYAAAGDSSIVYFSRKTGVEIVATDEYQSRGLPFEILNFIGRPEFERPSKVGRIILEKGDRIALMSDGVLSPYKPGSITYKSLEHLHSASNTTQQFGNELLQRSSIKDDKAAVVIERV